MILATTTILVSTLVFYICFSSKLLAKSTSVKLLISFGFFAIGAIVLGAKSMDNAESVAAERFFSIFLIAGIAILCIVMLVGGMFVLFPYLSA